MKNDIFDVPGVPKDLPDYVPTDPKALRQLAQVYTEWAKNAQEACERASDVTFQCVSRTEMFLAGMGKSLVLGVEHNFPQDQLEQLHRTAENLEFRATLAQSATNICKDMAQITAHAIERFQAQCTPDLVTHFEPEDSSPE